MFNTLHENKISKKIQLHLLSFYLFKNLLLPCDSNYILTQLVIPLSLISFENFTYM